MRHRTISLVTLALAVLVASPADAAFGRSKKNTKQSGSSSSTTSSSTSSSSSSGSGASSSGAQDGASRPRERGNQGGFGRARSGDATRDTAERRPRADSDSTVVLRPRLRPRTTYFYDPYWDDSPYYGARWGLYPRGYYAYGYHPYYGAPPLPPDRTPPPPSTTVGALFVGAFGGGAGPELTGEFALDGLEWGFNLRALSLGNPLPDGPGYERMPLFAGHVTYSFVSLPHARVRAEFGASGIVAPDFAYYGPDVGLSGQFALAGPLALEAAMRLTPLPARIIDGEAGLALRAGFRAVWLDDRGAIEDEDGGTLGYFGPQASVGAVF